MTKQNYIVTAHQKDVVNTMESKHNIFGMHYYAVLHPQLGTCTDLHRRALNKSDLAEEQWREGKAADRVHFFVNLLKGAADVLQYKLKI